MTALIDRLNILLDSYAEQDKPVNTRNLEAFRDEGSVYVHNLLTFVHLGDGTPTGLEVLTRDWLSREKKLYLDVKNPEKGRIAMFYGALKAQGMAGTEINTELTAKISGGEFDMFAALVPGADHAEMYEALAQVGVESDLIDPPRMFESATRA